MQDNLRNRIPQVAALSMGLLSLLSLLGLLFVPMLVQAGQPNPQNGIETVVLEIQERLSAGDRQALRDLAPLIDRRDVVMIGTRYGSQTAPVRDFALSLLATYCSFDKLAKNGHLTGEAYRRFLDSNWELIEYEELIDAFTDAPLTARASEYQLRAPRVEDSREQQLAHHVRELNRSVSKQNWYSAVEEIYAIGKISTPQAREFLTECARGENWVPEHNTREEQIYSAIAYGLGNYESLEAARLILDILAEHEVYSESDCVNALSKITNNDPVFLDEAKDVEAAYRGLIEQYPSLMELREEGFRRAGVKREDHDSSLEFFRAVLASSPNMWWIRYNAIRELLRLRDSGALELVASLLTRQTVVYNEYLGRPQLFPVEEIRGVTGVDVAVRDASGAWTTNYRDKVAKFNYVVYWVNHHSDWSWDDDRGCFTNAGDQVAAASRYDILFEQLYSEDDSTAMDAYIELAKGEPDQVIARLGQYPLQIFGPREGNSSLPMFGDKFLRQLVQLTAYCREKGFRFDLTKDLNEKLDLLDGDLSFVRRYELENRIIDEAGLDDLTSIEFYGALYASKNNALSLSIGRILDTLYAKHWQSVVSEPRHLDFYRAKAGFFDAFGIVGTCNDYWDRLHRLTLERKPSSEEIRRPNAEGGSNTTSDGGPGLEEFLAAVADGGEPPPGQLIVEPTRDNFRRIVDLIANCEDVEALIMLLGVMQTNLALEMVPELFRIIELPIVLHRGEISRHDTEMQQHGISFEVTVSDVVVALLEQIYDHSFPLPADPEPGVSFVSSSYSGWANLRGRGSTAAQWIALGKSDGADYRHFKQRFLSEALAAIEASPSVSFGQANRVWRLLKGSEDARERWLEVVALVESGSNLALLIIEASLQPEHLSSFKEFALTPEGLVRLIKQVDSSHPGAILAFLEPTIATLSKNDRGRAWYKLVWNTDLLEWLKRPDPASQRIKETIRKELRAFSKLVETDFDATHVARFQAELDNLGASFSQRLTSASRIEDSKIRRKFLERVLDDLQYHDIGVALQELSFLRETGDWTVKRAFLGQVGVPLLEFDPDWIEQVLSWYLNEPSLSFYRTLALHFDETLIDSKGHLDYGRACETLRFGLAQGFVGSSSVRADNVFPLIRWLEASHNRSFGPPKLKAYIVENAKQWISFLVAEGLTDPACVSR